MAGPAYKMAKGQPDPRDYDMQDVGMTVARDALGRSMGHIQSSWELVSGYIKRGPDGVEWLCFIAGLASTVIGFISALGVLTVFNNPVGYMVGIYQFSMGIMTCIIEAPEEFLIRSQKLQRAQSFIHEFAKFLTTFGGRGVFYFLQGTVDFGNETLGIVEKILGGYMFFISLLCILMQFKLIPEAKSKKPTVSLPVDGDYIDIR
mmetsp:Transcript_45186/g.79553  ORF Transcript_45186/g.79553 Transcript_45186/m.79553 type:complete len:204 (+) Transcript_45186:124-735(+)